MIFQFSYLHLLSLYLISLLLFPCASVWVNTRAVVPYFQQPYWMVLAFFSDSATTSAQCVFGAKRYKYLCTSKPEPLNYCFRFLFLLNICWYCGAGVFGLILCKSPSSNNKIIIIIIKKTGSR